MGQKHSIGSILLLVLLLLAPALRIQPAQATARQLSLRRAAVVPFEQFLRNAGIEVRGRDKRTGFVEYRLKSNRMTILLAERHSAPVVTVMMLYKVGSRNEATGYTGATHFLEHMMFKGSKNFDPVENRGIDDVLKPIGGINNATTSFDRTSYFEVVPAKDLSLCLEFEADRVRNLLLREGDRKAEMTVVRNELERQENESDALLHNQLFATAFRAHPYHNPIIGWRTDVEGVPTERLRQFYRDFYWADNTTLLLVGDFGTRDALGKIARYFRTIPKSAKAVPTVYTQEPPQEGERRFTIKKGADQPKVMVGFHVPKATDQDSYPLAVIESLLGDESRKSSRLYKALISTGLASDVYAAAYQLRDPGLFVMKATARAEQSLDKIEQTMQEQLDKLKVDAVPDAELARVKASIVKRLKLDAADPLRLASQVGEAIAVADWKWWAILPDKIAAVSTADIKRVACKYFKDTNRTVGYYRPKVSQPAQEPSAVQPPAASGSGESPGDPVVPSVKIAPAPVTAATGTSVSSRVKRKVFSNGLTVLLLPVPGTGTVSVAGKIRAGDYFAPADKSMLPELTADALSYGASGLSKEQLAQELEAMGTSLEFDAGSFWMRFNSDMTTEDTGRFLNLLAKVLTQPSFEASALSECKGIMESEIKQKMDDTKSLAWNELLNTAYKPGNVYYEKPFKDQLAELSTLTADDARDFHRRYFTPGNAVLCLVGDIDPQQAFSLIESSMSQWQAGTVDKIVPPAFELPHHAEKFVVSIPDKENVDIYIGHPTSINLKDNSYFAEVIGNSALGHDPFASRLAPVRSKHGLTYDIGSSNVDTSFGGAPWVIEFSVNPSNIDRALTLVNQLVSTYQKQGIGESELKEEAGRLSGQFLVALRTPRALAESLSRFEMAGVGPAFIDRYPVEVKKVSRAKVNEAIRKYFRLDRAITTMAGTIKK